ncbi:MAG TPA: DnaB-like helicase C-terminal domain-containing protein [bacterium]|nr:DnaB-like helicase C-terminal domain-containing protein [bacterium]
MAIEVVQEFDYLTAFENLGKNAVGPMMYIERLDEKVRGMPKRMVVIAGFSGSLKTTYALNLAYNNAVGLGYSSCFISLEMEPEEQMLRLAVRHAQHPSFRKYNFKITVNKVLLNTWSKEERDFMEQIVVPDLQRNPGYGRIHVTGPSDFQYSIAGIECMLLALENHAVEVGAPGLRQTIDILIVDYVQLLAKYAGFANGSGSDPYRFTGEVFTYLRRLTTTYAKERGITVVALSQLNRASYTAAKDRIRNARIPGERYDNLFDATSFAESSAIMSDADVAVALYSDDELKKQLKVRIQLLKNRRGESDEKGFDALAMPEVAYVGDWQNDTATDDYIGELLSDVLVD